MTTALGDLGIDPSTPGFALRPDYYDVLARLRAEAPVYEYAPGVKVVTRYRDIREISADPQRFCSGRGVLVNDPIREGATLPGSILHMDPPFHNEWRRILNREFTPRAVGRLEDRVRALTVAYLDALPRGEEFDLVGALTAPLPVFVICELLGVPESVRTDFRRWSDAAIVASDGRGALSPEDATSVMELVTFLAEFAQRKAADPDDDVVSKLVTAEVEGRLLESDELVTFTMSLLVAGNETTRHLMSGSLMEFSTHTDQRSLLEDDPARIPGAVEECLRWITPIQQFARTATCDTELSGTSIDEGDYLVMIYASGNRDEDVFGETANVFDVQRDAPAANLAFGFGQHLCLGAALARMEARVLFEELAARRSVYHQVGEAEYLPSSLVRGPDTVPFLFE